MRFRPRRRHDLPDDAFDVAIAGAADCPEVLVDALGRAGIEARVVEHDRSDAVVKVRHVDLPEIQEALERQRR